MKKQHLSTKRLYNMVASQCVNLGNRTLSHCDVRCMCNDILEIYERDGYIVPYGYSQDAAFRKVRALIVEFLFAGHG